MSRDSEETTEIHRGEHRRPSGADIPSADLVGLLREILRGQRRIDGELAEIKERLAKGASTLDEVEEMRAREREQRDRFVAMETKVSGVLWVAGVAAAIAIGAIVTALFAVILKPHAGV